MFFRYDIIKPPQFGVVERLRILDGTWQNVDSFTSQMVAFGRLRYSHLVGLPPHDEFKVIIMQFYQNFPIHTTIAIFLAV